MAVGDGLTGEEKLLNAIVNQSWQDMLAYFAAQKNGRKINPEIRNSVLTDKGQAQTGHFWNSVYSKLYMKRYNKIKSMTLEEMKSFSLKFKKESKNAS